MSNPAFVTLDAARLNAAVQELLYGLTTDGAHHKQYALERVFLALCTEEYVNEAREEFGWEEGIA